MIRQLHTSRDRVHASRARMSPAFRQSEGAVVRFLAQVYMTGAMELPCGRDFLGGACLSLSALITGVLHLKV